MANKTILFGRAVSGENTKLIAEPDVSSKHAQITYLGNDQFEIEDLGSQNGTYVNGYRIRKTVVSINDQVRLSSGVELDLVKEFGIKPSIVPNAEIPKQDPKDFTVEFERLKPIYEQYKKDKKKIIVGHNKKTALIRSGITIAPLPILFLELGSTIPGLTLVAAGFANFITGNMYNNDKIEELDDNFRIRYVCPNPQCKIQLGNNSWKVWNETGKCFRCGAIYSKHNSN